MNSFERNEAILNKIKGSLIVSCQALEDEPLHGPEFMARMALAAQLGGAQGIRANSVPDICAIRKVTDLPIIGIIKRNYPDSACYITPTLKEADELITLAGPEIIAVDATEQIHPGGITASDYIRAVKEKYPHQLLMADVSTFEEGMEAERAGADLVSTTLSGYTSYSPSLEGPDFALMAQLSESLSIPVIGEGRIWCREEAQRALETGVHAVVAGTAITRPMEITKRFVIGMKREQDKSTGIDRSLRVKEKELTHKDMSRNCAIAVDIGGTRIKYGLVDGTGRVILKKSCSSEAHKGASHLMELVKMAISEVIGESNPYSVMGIGIGSAGQIEPGTGRVLYATSTIPGYSGMDIKRLIEEEFRLKTCVENDVNAAVVGEAWKGAGAGVSRVLCLTVGTGIGGSILVDGSVEHGFLGSAGEAGHMVIRMNGRPCSCGNKGCWEQYASASALIRNYLSRTAKVKTSFDCAKMSLTGTVDAESIFRLEKAGDPCAAAAVSDFVKYLGAGIVNLLHILNPERVILGGGIFSEGEYLLERIFKYVERHAMPSFVKGLGIVPAALGNEAGMIGAARLVFRNQSKE